MEGMLGCNFNMYSKFYNNVFLFEASNFENFNKIMFGMSI